MLVFDCIRLMYFDNGSKYFFCSRRHVQFREHLP
jgi:YHS domain-containing protein